VKSWTPVYACSVDHGRPSRWFVGTVARWIAGDMNSGPLAVRQERTSRQLIGRLSGSGRSVTYRFRECGERTLSGAFHVAPTCPRSPGISSTLSPSVPRSRLSGWGALKGHQNLMGGRPDIRVKCVHLADDGPELSVDP
jgi:hypothetical protein